MVSGGWVVVLCNVLGVCLLCGFKVSLCCVKSKSRLLRHNLTLHN
jgi:hypothetical protein